MENLNPHLVVGSVWARTANNATSTVLAVSNQDLKADVLEKFPQQVVFLTSKYKILTQDIDTFLRNRVYQGIDPTVVSLMEALTTEPEPEEDDDVDIDSVDLPAEKSFDSMVASTNEESEESEESEEDDTIPVFEPAEFDGLALDRHFLSYSEAPYHTGDTLHVLRFALDRELNIDQLRAIFRDSDQNTPTIDQFIIDSSEERVEVPVYAFVQVFMEVGAGGEGVAAVHLLSSGDFRADAPGAENTAAVTAPTQSAEPVLIPQLQVVPGTAAPTNANLQVTVTAQN